MSDIKEHDDLTGRFKYWIDERNLEPGDSLTVILEDKRELVFRLEDIYTYRDEANVVV